jgi:acyl-CoA thioester hydrolase
MEKSNMPHFRTTRRVEFGDTDMAGIMHFSNFFKFMEVAETSFLHSLGYSVTWVADGIRYGFPRVSVKCDFFKPARFEDELVMEVRVAKVGTKSVTYQILFLKNEDKIAEGQVTSVLCRGKAHGMMETIEIPMEMRAKLEPASVH